MPKANWVLVNPDHGSGNGSVSVTAGSNHTGRNARTSSIMFSAVNCEDISVPVSQAGKPEFVTIEATKSVAKGGVPTLTITGTSNSSKLTFSLGNGNLALTLPESYTANSVSTANGADISGDPGAAQEFSFSIQFSNIPENVTIDEMSRQLIVTDNAGNTATCTITQAAGDATLSVSPATLQLDWNAATEGTSATASVTSNTNWNVG